eukprot:Blabericola_migrator_1__2309@NODE_1642_length_4108_cov_92_265281_g1069_i0_p1_GENE_NODE_1642_length_4108_cov_92_265281_g1069_i0NODE_1642_length_4108_cov_92_265281_g1069_i0_p1_ORF_typecomplete_len534_score94_84ParA/PF10609_9/2_1e69AAA_31/PF13614_6/4_8e16CBP_BcsQ/PF06564_12/4_6e16CbiA/PF01656_23/4_4e16DUF971/PF06155_12/2_9e15FeS_assembly_P/PF01883_19/1_4e13MipZ/PF09140_11/5_7e11VirC1/PF07015_11/7_6e05VirC1/PF07015_11/23ArsA_ATPase/PF02374_15/0_0035ArsA_ATPase/PF02374_15/12Fer4_NifH/PF00142_18/3_7e0
MVIGLYGADDENALPPHRDPVILREQVLYQLRKVIDPDLYKDIVTCGFVKNLTFDFDAGNVKFTLQLTTPACPVKDQFVAQCTSLLKELGWVETVDITVSAEAQKLTFPGDAAKNLSNVSFILAVSSCKGGVGKSSMAVNVAYMLKRLGARVGLCDCDVYGPSLHTLIPLEDPKVLFQVDNANEVVKDSLAKGDGSLIPLEHQGVKLMSYSYFRPDAEAYAGVRGPIASNLVYQMVTQTAWGGLDYLILDMPPGTGDIHLTLCQSVKMSGAVVVTTPQQLSLIDMEKGVHFYEKMGIPTLGLIENMAYMECPSCKYEVPLFQSTFTLDLDLEEAKKTDCHSQAQSSKKIERLLDQFGVGLHLRLPLDPRLSAVTFKTGDTETFPFAAAFNEMCDSWKRLNRFCQELTRAVSTAVYGDNRVPEITTTSDGLLQMSIQSGAESQNVYMTPLRTVRLSCKCAQCVDENSGQVKLKARSVPIDVHPVKMEQSNNYSVKITWSDGHHSIMSYKLLLSLGEKLEQSTRVACIADDDLDW